MKNKYRVVRDMYAGYEVQVKYWYWPFCWIQCSFCNTFSTVEAAKTYIDIVSNKEVLYETKQ